MQYRRPTTMDDALRILAEARGSGRVLVGGTDLLVHVRREPLEPLVLVDLKTASDLPNPVEITNTSVTFGPTAVMADLYNNPKIASWYPALVDAAKVVGSVAIRNRASLIGNVCNASPACDTAPALLVYGAEVSLLGAKGRRTVPLDEFFVGPGKTICGSDELVVGLTLPVRENDGAGFGSAFERLTRRRGVDLATVSVAAGVTAAGEITLGLGAVAPTPLRTAISAPVDCGDRAAVEVAVDELVSIARPISDIRASGGYRSAMVHVLGVRAVMRAAEAGRDEDESNEKNGNA